MARKIVALALLVASAVAVVGGRHVSASDGNGVIQPGDDFGGCTTGPTVWEPNIGWRVFTAAHCNPRIGSGETRTSDGLRMYQAGSDSNVDARWWTTNNPVSQTVTTKVNGFAADVAVKGVIRPWPGMQISKSGQTSQVSAGVVSHEWWLPWVPQNARWRVDGMLQCSGDSGSPAYVTLPSGVYIVGMVTNGTGSLLDSLADPNPRKTPQGTCAPAPRKNSDMADIRGIDAMCVSANLAECASTARNPIGQFESLTLVPEGVRVGGWAFDPSVPGTTVDIAVSIDGQHAGSAVTVVDRPDLVEPWMLKAVRSSAGRQLGFDQVIPARLTRGSHEVCFDALDVETRRGTRVGCQSISVGEQSDFLIRWGGDQYDLMIASTGGRSFTPYPNVLGSNVGTESPIYPGDFNGDGKTDFLMTEAASNQYHVFIRTENGFDARWNIFNGGIGVVSEPPTLGDFNGDHRTDFLIRWGRDRYDLLLAQPDGRSFTPMPNVLGSIVGTEPPIYPGDFNGDGMTDLLMTEAAKNQYHVFLSTGGGFDVRWNIFNGGIGVVSEPPTLGDFNGDHRTDFLIRWGDNHYDLLLAQPDGRSFTPLPNVLGGHVGTSSPVYPGDFNGDGMTDLLMTQWPNQYHVFLSTGNGLDVRWNVFKGGLGVVPEPPTFGDFNGDGRTDFLIRWGRTRYDLLLAQPDGSAFAGYGNIFSDGVGTETQRPVVGQFG